MQLTSDQLAYVLERKFIGIQVGKDVIVYCTGSMDNDNEFVHNADAVLSEWKLKEIAKPSDEEIMGWWEKIKEQYHSDPYRPDSEMYLYLKQKEKQSRPPILINEDI